MSFRRLLLRDPGKGLGKGQQKYDACNTEFEKREKSWRWGGNSDVLRGIQRSGRHNRPISLVSGRAIAFLCMYGKPRFCSWTPHSTPGLALTLFCRPVSMSKTVKHRERRLGPTVVEGEPRKVTIDDLQVAVWGHGVGVGSGMRMMGGAERTGSGLERTVDTNTARSEIRTIPTIAYQAPTGTPRDSRGTGDSMGNSSVIPQSKP
ncbi:hypothetical protein EDB83DRAFT_2313801 [Lactarius deliciosus]|nr:hypothetical protein EDB83DRAFT_2313801 [Lactarius deliciosus]